MVQPLWTALDAVLGPHVAAGALLCVSGGPDSRTLLETVARWPGRFLGDVQVACVDHGVRADGAAEAAAVVARAHALGLAGHVLRVRASAHDEAALRDARYAALVALARRARLASLVVAHHRGDVAEGRLLQLWGAGGGVLVPAARRDGLWVLRPFLSLPREALAVARTALGVEDVIEDPERRSARARLRANVVPRLPDSGRVEERAALDAARRAEDEDTLVPMAAALVDDGRRDGVRVRPGRPALVRRALQAALRALAPGVDVRASGPALDDVLALLTARRRGQIHLAGGVVASVDDEGVWLEPRQLAGGATPAYAAWDVGGDAREGTEDS